MGAFGIRNEQLPKGKIHRSCWTYVEIRKMNPILGTDGRQSVLTSSCRATRLTGKSFPTQSGRCRPWSVNIFTNEDRQWSTDVLRFEITCPALYPIVQSKSALAFSIRSITATPKGHRFSQFPQAMQSSALALSA